MNKVFVLQRVHVLDDETEDVKLIGVYSSRENAQSALARLSRETGFRESADGFHIDEYVIDADQWTSGFVTRASA